MNIQQTCGIRTFKSVPIPESESKLHYRLKIPIYLFEAKQFIVALGHILRGSKFKTLKINSAPHWMIGGAHSSASQTHSWWEGGQLLPPQEPHL